MTHACIYHVNNDALFQLVNPELVKFTECLKSKRFSVNQ